MRMRVAAATAASGLRAHRGTAILLAAIAAAGLAAALPVARLGSLSGRSLQTRLLLASTPAAPEPGWAIARTPTELHAEAVRVLFQALAGAAMAAVTVAALGVLLLFAARVGERVSETTLRRAVGAPRRTLMAAALLEGGLLAVLAVGVALVLAWPAARAASATWPGQLAAGPTLPAVAAAIAMSLIVLAGAVLGEVFAPRRRLIEAAPQPLGLAIPSAQLALALVTLTAGALLVRQARTAPVMSGRPGAGEIYGGSATLAEAAVRATRYATLLQSLKAGTNFDSVSLVSMGTVVGLGTVSIATTDCGLCPWGNLLVPWHSVPTTHRFVSADSFQALGVRVIAGRGISVTDTWSAARVAVVSQALARRHFQDGRAIGRRVLLGDDDRTWHTVVGVVEDGPTEALGSALLPEFSVYASVLQHPPMNVELLVRQRAGARPGPDIRAALAGALGATPGDVRRVGEREMVASELTPVGWFGRLFQAEGWAILLIAAVASAVQMSLWVRSRQAELGLRRAVGATRRRVIGLVLLRAAGVGAAGTAGGLLLGPSTWSALGTIVSGLPAWDAALVLRFAAVLIAISTISALVPAWEASRAQPSRLLAAAG